MVKNDFKLKQECKYNFVEGDFQATPSNVTQMLAISFMGSFSASFCGIAPGGIFCMALIYLGVEPTVGSATGMYMVLITTLSATI